MSDERNATAPAPEHRAGIRQGRSQRTRALRAGLWRRRLFEAEAGLTRFVAEVRSGAHLHDLVRVKHEIFEDLPETTDEEAWKSTFFRGQALMEKFVVGHFGHDGLPSWASSNSAIYNAIDSRPRHDATVPLERLDSQAALYASDTGWEERGPDRAVLRIRHCAIWDYRELARDRGVTLTLQSPCEYCVPATTAMITYKGLAADHELTCDESGHGCVWTASRESAEPTPTDQDTSEG